MRMSKSKNVRVAQVFEFKKGWVEIWKDGASVFVDQQGFL